MTIPDDAYELRKSLLKEYYTNIYQQYLFGKSAQSAGIDYFERAVEKFWSVTTPDNVLEIGGGSGEHLKYLKYIPNNKYVSLDLNQPFTDKHIAKLSSSLKSKLEFIEGDAGKIPFNDGEFDRIFSTCLLHHVDDVLSVLLEVRRASKTGGEIAFVIPTDPGWMNQIVKKYISYPRMKKFTKLNPKLFYALEHKNHVGGILELIKYVFRNDQLELHYRPFRFKSWNLNLLVVAKITKI